MQAPKPHKPGRNDPCSCGSQKKFKICCGGPGPSEIPCTFVPIHGTSTRTEISPSAEECRKDTPTLSPKRRHPPHHGVGNLVIMSGKFGREGRDPAKVWYRAGVGHRPPANPTSVVTMIRGPDARSPEDAAQALRDECEKKVATKGEAAAG